MPFHTYDCTCHRGFCSVSVNRAQPLKLTFSNHVWSHLTGARDCDRVGSMAHQSLSLLSAMWYLPAWLHQTSEVWSEINGFWGVLTQTKARNIKEIKRKSYNIKTNECCDIRSNWYVDVLIFTGMDPHKEHTQMGTTITKKKTNNNCCLQCIVASVEWTGGMSSIKGCTL